MEPRAWAAVQGMATGQGGTQDTGVGAGEDVFGWFLEAQL